MVAVALDQERALGPSARQRTVRVLVVHGHDVSRSGYRSLISREPWTQRCVCAETPDEAVAMAARYEPHVALLGCDRSTSIGRLIGELRRVCPGIRCLLSSDEAGTYDDLAVAAGAAGVISASWPARELMDAIYAMATGAKSVVPPCPGDALGLSVRQRQVILELATGATNREIAQRLFLSAETVKHHTSSAYRKLGARNRVDAVERARWGGLLGAAGETGGAWAK